MEKQLVLVSLSKKYNIDSDVNLFLVKDGLTYGYVLIAIVLMIKHGRLWSMLDFFTIIFQRKYSSDA